MFEEKHKTAPKEGNVMLRASRASNPDRIIDQSVYKDEHDDWQPAPSQISRRPLSVSRSGRCRSKNKTRSRMLSEELYVKDDLAIHQDVAPVKDSRSSAASLAEQPNGSTTSGTTRTLPESGRITSGTSVSSSTKPPIQSSITGGSTTRSALETSRTSSGMASSRTQPGTSSRTQNGPVTTTTHTKTPQGVTPRSNERTYAGGHINPGPAKSQLEVASTSASRLQPRTTSNQSTPRNPPPAPTRQTSQTSSGMSTCDTSSPSSRSSSTTEREFYSTAL